MSDSGNALATEVADRLALTAVSSADSRSNLPAFRELIPRNAGHRTRLPATNHSHDTGEATCPSISAHRNAAC